jgi:hypothetical protein
MKTTLLILTLSQAAALGQDYQIDWFTISGGGPSSGGSYSPNGAIGQASAGGLLANGSFSALGGYWTFLMAVQTPEAPFLSVARDLTGSVTVWWPRPANGWVLEQTDAFAPAPIATTWSQVAPPYNTTATAISVTVPSPVETRFYRLHKQ